LYGTTKTNVMTLSFTYQTKLENKEVLLFDIKMHGSYLVEVTPEGRMVDKIQTYKFDTYEGALKKFNSIKKRVGLI
tara:strand:- start:777 stop:1004 length:228 start_codon:yes stop_codon:yes gene_type:complete